MTRSDPVTKARPEGPFIDDDDRIEQPARTLGLIADLFER